MRKTHLLKHCTRKVYNRLDRIMTYLHIVFRILLLILVDNLRKPMNLQAAEVLKNLEVDIVVPIHFKQTHLCLSLIALLSI